MFEKNFESNCLTENYPTLAAGANALCREDKYDIDCPLWSNAM